MGIWCRVGILLLALGVAMALAQIGLSAQPASFASLVKGQRDKVVHIGIKGKVQPKAGRRLSPFRFPESRQGMGSGFIVSAQGLIVTNLHVIADSENIAVILANGKKYVGRVVGVDERTDLALLRIDGKGLPFIEFGDSAAVEVGDWVLAIGNPLGLDHSVTAGIVSAKGRNIFDGENLAYGEFIQTDAAINPGNSGGPLFNLQGQVIGVNTAISSRGHGIGFAVPSNLVVRVVRQLREQGRVLRGWVGVVIEQVTPELAGSLGLPELQSGLLVDEALAGAPAAVAGIREGDVLLRFAGESLRGTSQLQKLVAFSKRGSRVEIIGLRRAKPTGPWQRFRVHVRIGTPPDQMGTGLGSAAERLGLVLREPPPGLRQRMGLRPGVGLLVESVTPHGTAADTGLRKGDVLLEVGHRKVGTPADVQRILAESRNPRLPLLVRRDRQVLYLVILRLPPP